MLVGLVLAIEINVCIFFNLELNWKDVFKIKSYKKKYCNIYCINGYYDFIIIYYIINYRILIGILFINLYVIIKFFI